MATRIYLPNTGASAINPTFGTWTETTGADRLAAVTVRISSAMTSKVQAHAATAANSTFLSRQYVIGPLAGQTYGASTIKGTIRVLESAANDNLDAMRLLVRVVAPDATTFRGTIYGPTNGTVLEFNTALRAKRLASGGATTSVVITEGDYLVIDIGTTSTVGGTSLSDTISYGDDSATDLGDNETDTTALNPFVELAANMIFLRRSVGQAQAQIIGFPKQPAQAAALINGLYTTVNDTFTRSVVDGLGDSGSGLYTIESGAAADFDVNGTAATIVLPTQTVHLAAVPNILNTLNTESIITYSINTLPISNALLELGTHLNSRTLATIKLIGWVNILSTGEVDLNLGYENSAGAGVITGLTYAAGENYYLKFRVLQTNQAVSLFLKTWKVGTAEPDWQYTFTTANSGALIPHARGHTMFEVVQNGGSVTYTLDDYQVYEAFPVAHGQSQAKINAFGVKAYGQAQASVFGTRYLISGGTPAKLRVSFYGTTGTFQEITTGLPNATDISGAAVSDIDQWVIGNDSGDIATSTNGLNWTNQTSGIATPIHDIAWGQNKWVVVGAGGVILTSLDGITWTPQTSQLSGNTAYRVNYENGLWVVAGAGAAISTSPDGTAWTARTSGFDSSTSIYGLAKGNGIWAVVNEDGKVSTSSDGLTWSVQTVTGLTGIPRALDFFAGLFIIVGNSGIIYTSPDAVAWTSRTSGFGADDILSIDHGDTLILAAGSSGKIASSSDGITWTEFVFGSSIAWGIAVRKPRFKIAQAQATIKSTVNAFGQAQAQILRLQVYGQGQAFITKSKGLGQAQARIKQVYQSYAQSQADIKAIYKSFAQSQADVNRTYNAFAQAQATILAWRFGQAQADIKQTYQGYAQSQTDIKQTYNAFGQANADIKATTNNFAQSNADIKSVSNSFAQSQADIKATSNAFAQSQARILQVYNAFAQGQADIKVTSNGFSQAQVDVKQVYQGYGQAQADILHTYQGYAQANADILATINKCGQSQADIKAVTHGFGQAQAFIIYKQRANGQAAALVAGLYGLPFLDTFNRVVVDSLGTSDNGDTWTFISGTAANADVNGTNATLLLNASGGTSQLWRLPQTLATLDQGFEISGKISLDKNPATFPVQVNLGLRFSSTGLSVTVSDTYNVVAKINGNGTTVVSDTSYTPGTVLNVKVHLVSSSDSRTVVKGKAWLDGDLEPGWATEALLNFLLSSQSLEISADSVSTNRPIIVTLDDFAVKQAWLTKSAQAKARIKQVYSGFAQAQADIKAVGYGFAQAQSDIKQTYQSYANTQADIKATLQSYGQSQARILQVYVPCGQASAGIKQTYQALAQAQADTVTSYQAYAQAQGQIKQTYITCAQAQADILVTSVGVGQAQGTTLATSNKFAQANAGILAQGFGFGQANAQIVAFGVNKSGNAQGNIAGASYPSAQAQGYIRIIQRSYGQAQAEIQSAVTRSGYGQAEGSILTTTNQCAQSQADILVTTSKCANAAARIKTTAFAVAQAPGYIVRTNRAYAQAQAAIKTTNVVVGTAQALILTTVTKSGNAQALIRTTVIVSGQALAEIIRVVSAQAAAYIKVAHTLKRTTLSDQMLRTVLTDRERTTTIHDHSLRLISSDRGINTKLTDRGLRINLSDRNY